MNEWLRRKNEVAGTKYDIKDLEREAKVEVGKAGTKMYFYMQKALADYQQKRNLSEVESVAVWMYTDDSDHAAFFKEFNRSL